MVGGRSDVRNSSPESRMVEALRARDHDVELGDISLLRDSKRFDLVHIHHRSKEALKFMARPRKKPVMFTGHSWLVFPKRYHRLTFSEQIHRQALFTSYALSRSPIVLGAAEAAVLAKRPGISNVSVAGNVTHKAFLDNRATDFAKGDYITYVGQLIPHKGVDTLVRALVDTPDITLKLIYHLDSNRPELEDLARTLGVQDRLEFVGNQTGDELVETIGCARALVLPSWGECLPSVVTESKILGTRVVATDVGMVSSQLDSDDQLFAPGDSLGLAKKLRECLSRGAPVLENVRLRAAEASSPGVIGKTLEDIYVASL